MSDWMDDFNRRRAELDRQPDDGVKKKGQCVNCGKKRFLGDNGQCSICFTRSKK